MRIRCNEDERLCSINGSIWSTAKQLLSITKLHVPWCRAGLHRWRSQVSLLTLWGGGGLFSVEKAICPSVSSERLVPTGRKRDGYLKKNGRQDEGSRGVMQERMKNGKMEGINKEGKREKKVRYIYGIK